MKNRLNGALSMGAAAIACAAGHANAQAITSKASIQQSFELQAAPGTQFQLVSTFNYAYASGFGITTQSCVHRCGPMLVQLDGEGFGDSTGASVFADGLATHERCWIFSAFGFASGSVGTQLVDALLISEAERVTQDCPGTGGPIAIATAERVFNVVAAGTPSWSASSAIDPADPGLTTELPSDYTGRFAVFAQLFQVVGGNDVLVASDLSGGLFDAGVGFDQDANAATTGAVGALSTAGFTGPAGTYRLVVTTLFDNEDSGSALDFNRDGVLSSQDLDTLLGLPTSTITAHTQFFLDRYDTDSDGVIDQDEIDPLAGVLNALAGTALLTGDVNGDGVFDCTDLIGMPANWALSPIPVPVPNPNPGLDLDGDGFVDNPALDANFDGLIDEADRVILVGIAQPSDVNRDGTTDLADQLAVQADFGGPPMSGFTDVDGSGTVDLADLLAVLADFGTSCP